MKLTPQTRLLFIGDSITDCQRARPFGRRGGLGNGYVNLVAGLLGAAYPEIPLDIINTGIGGNRVIDLEARWSEDVTAHEPDWLSIMIGINDVWRQFDCAGMRDQVDPERFRAVYTGMLERTRQELKLQGLVMMTPFLIEPNAEETMRAMMDDYGQIVKELAGQFDAIFVDIQAAFNAYTAKASAMSLAGDRIHPNVAGHMVIAKAFCAAIDADIRRV